MNYSSKVYDFENKVISTWTQSDIPLFQSSITDLSSSFRRNFP